MAIPHSILRKPGPLTDDEKQIMRTHCEMGYNMLIRIPFLRAAAEIVLAHQEFFNGSGYPRSLKGEQIPLGARIFTIADSLDAMISDRPYRKALPLSHARSEIKRCSGTQFDPQVVDVFIAIPEQHWLEFCARTWVRRSASRSAQPLTASKFCPHLGVWVGSMAPPSCRLATSPISDSPKQKPRLSAGIFAVYFEVDYIFARSRTVVKIGFVVEIRTSMK